VANGMQMQQLGTKNLACHFRACHKKKQQQENNNNKKNNKKTLTCCIFLHSYS
jgi:hypothetical protein